MRRTVGALVLAVFVLVVGCAGPEPGAERITVVTTQPVESLTYAPEMVAIARGDFARHGLEVDLQALQGSPPALQSVLSGSAQLTRLGDVETMIAVGLRSAPLRVVGAEMTTGPQRIVSHVDDPIRVPADLAGKTVGLPSLGGTSEATLNLVLARGGVDPASVRREVTGLAPGVFDLVASGRVDAFVAPVDTAVVLAHTRPDAVVLDTSQVISAGAQVYVSTTDQLGDPVVADRIRRYLAAVHEAMDFIADDAATGYAETVRLIGTRYTVPSLADPATAKAGLDTYVGLWGPLRGSLPPERWQEIYAEVSGSGIVPAGLEPDGWLQQLGPA